MPKMVAFGGSAWLSLLATSATALRYPAVHGHLSCVARVNPAMARLGRPMAVVKTSTARPPMIGTPMSRVGVYRRHGSERWTSSLRRSPRDGWQDDVADTKDVWNPVQEMSRMRHK